METIAFCPTVTGVTAAEERRRLFVEAVYNCRVTTNVQLHELTGLSPNSRQLVNKELKKLRDERWLDEPEITKRMFQFAAERPKVHALGDVGARYCRDVLGLPVPETTQWGRKNRELKDLSRIHHWLGVSKARIRFQAQLRDDPRYRLVQTAEVVAKTPAAGSPDHVAKAATFPTEYRWTDEKHYTRPTIADWLFQIQDKHSDTPRFMTNLLEWDRATEPLTRKTPNLSSILQKDFGYADMWDRKLVQQRFKVPSWRRLFVTEGGENWLHSCINLWEGHQRCPADLFLYTTAEAFMSSDVLRDPIWVNGRRQRKVLLGE